MCAIRLFVNLFIRSKFAYTRCKIWYRSKTLVLQQVQFCFVALPYSKVGSQVCIRSYDNNCMGQQDELTICLHNWGPFHKSSYERFLLYEFVELVLNYRSNEFVALTNLCETGSRLSQCCRTILYSSRQMYYQTFHAACRRNTSVNWCRKPSFRSC